MLRQSYIPHPLPLCCNNPVYKCSSASIVITSTLRATPCNLVVYAYDFILMRASPCDTITLFIQSFSLVEIKWPPGGASGSVLLLAHFPAYGLRNDVTFFMVHTADLCLICAILSAVLETDCNLIVLCYYRRSH